MTVVEARTGWALGLGPQPSFAGGVRAEACAFPGDIAKTNEKTARGKAWGGRIMPPETGGALIDQTALRRALRACVALSHEAKLPNGIRRQPFAIARAESMRRVQLRRICMCGALLAAGPMADGPIFVVPDHGSPQDGGKSLLQGQGLCA